LSAVSTFSPALYPRLTARRAQDLEYKLSGIQREFAGKIGSATFPHGAISLWNTEVLTKTFHEHPGFTVSEDWFFGHVARKLGSRIKMTSHIFVETETPSSVFFSGGGSRGGFGEMTIYSQRFKRWNFFFVNGMWYNMSYILFSWKLGFWEIGAKIFVFQVCTLPGVDLSITKTHHRKFTKRSSICLRHSFYQSRSTFDHHSAVTSSSRP